jgi:DNA processing protein
VAAIVLKEGARLVECVEDVLEDLAPQLGGSIQAASAKSGETGEPTGGNASFDSETADVKTILEYLKNDNRLHIDSIIERSKLNTQTVLRLLLELELRGLVTQHPGKLFSLA